MEEPVQQPAIPKQSRKWERSIRNILVGAIIMCALNYGLKKAGIDTWEKFDRKAGQVADSIKDGASRMTPVTLWRSLTQRAVSENSPAYYLPGYIENENLSFKHKILRWLGYYWFKPSGKAFWIGRIILILALIAGISIAVEDHRNSVEKTAATLVFPLNAVWKAILVLLMVGLACIVLYYFIKLFLAIGAPIVAFTSGLHVAGAFGFYVYDEVQGHVAGYAKDSIGRTLFPFLYKKKKPKSMF